MLLERFEVKGLAHYSYAVGCEEARAIAIIDPERNVDVYLAYAKAKNVRITHVLETHIHADYASGARELAAATSAQLLVSGHDAGEHFEVSFPHSDIRDGQSIEIGTVRLVAVHTPGHTPEHVSYLVYDGPQSTTPRLMLSGDFLFVGSLGRPDLLGEQAKHDLAAKLFRSVREKLRDLPDSLEIYPAHGAGSMCGAGMGGQPSSTLGAERAANPYLNPRLPESEFIQRLLGTVPPFPDYYRRMKKLNSEGPAILRGMPGQRAIPVPRFAALVEGGHTVIDLRNQLAYGAGHIPNAFGIGNGSMLATWAAWVIPYDTPIVLVGEEAADAESGARWLVRVGLDQIAGYLEGGMSAWADAKLPIRETPQFSPEDLHQQLQAGANLRVIDVRGRDEWNGGHIDGATHIMGGELAGRLNEMPDVTKPVAVICGGGYRSTVAASVLERAGYADVVNVAGGMGAWQRAGLPTVREQPVAAR